MTNDKKIKVCIDPGHGMSNKKSGAYDPGAMHGGLEEADVALQIALTLKWALEKAGIATLLTRTNDRGDDPVATRDNRATAAGCTHFLSIHLNSGASGVSGVETFYRDSADREFAMKVHVAAVAASGLPNRGLRPESMTFVQHLAVMDFKGPCALVEVGYLSNPKDRSVVTSRNYRLALAERVVEVMKAVKVELDARRSDAD
jgi:N-acetylmuramoyl-L-alanine amidase